MKLPNSKFWQIRFSLILALLSSWGLEVSTQESTESTSQTPPEIALTQSGLSLNSNLVKSELTQLEENKEIEAGLKETLTSLYQTALQRLEQASTYEATTEQIRNLINTGPENVKSIQSKLESLPSVTGSNAFTNHLAGVSPEASSKDLVQILTTDKLQQADLKNQIVALETELQTQKERPENNRLEQQEAKKRLNDINLSLQANAPEAEKPIERKAREISLEARRLARTRQLRMLEQEALSHEMRQNHIRISRDLKQRELDLLNARIKALEIESNKRRESEAEQARKESIKAKRETLLKAPLIVNIAETNTVLTAELSGLATQLSRLNPKQEVLKQQLVKISSDFNSISNQIHIGGVDRALVEILLDQRRRLPRLNILQREKTELEVMIKTNRLARFKVDTSLNNLPSPESLVRNEQTLSNTNELNTEMVIEVEKLLDQKKVYLTELNTNYGSLIDRLRNVNADYETKLQVVSRYRLFLDEKLMWVPTSTTILEWNKAPWLETSKWLLNPDHWKQTSSSVYQIIKRLPIQSAFIFLVSFGLLGFRKRLKNHAKLATQSIRRISTDSFWFTSRVALISFLLALALPLPLTYIGIKLTDPVLVESEFAQSLGFGAIFLGGNLFLMTFLYEICQPKGLAESHFRWSDRLLSLLRKHTNWFIGTIAVLGFITVILETQPVDAYRDSLGRLSYILIMVITVILLKIVFGPDKITFPTSQINSNPKARTGIWYWLMIGIPISLILLSIAGYYYAAIHIGLRLMASTWGILIALVLHDWGLRYFYIQERKIALEQALEKRRATSSVSNEKSVTDEAAFPTLDDPDVDLSVVKEQPRRLLRSVVGILLLIALWMIWSGVLPALNFLNTFVVWDHQVMVDEVLVSKETTLLNLIQFLIVGLLTIVAARNIPGVLEIAILQNLPLQSGSRYAITTICQYIIISFGVVFALSFFGIDWGQFGWILAALSVGLGFGLQEIVANFVCGILLFLERPIRVGDIVTVADVTGMVSRIQIRATTIMNWDQQEFIVPNKEFVTGRILNWTLTNSTNRITVKVGVAYGTDTNKARDILLDVAKQHPEVLDEPLPVVIFEEFGDSSLNLVLRIYLPTLEKRMATIHDLNTVIHQRFNEAGIEIPFPQRDIHIRSTISKTDIGNNK